ncbi:hypothetical protein GEMRC1_006462 [Eukaryota sp. GEM-RC1]
MSLTSSSPYSATSKSCSRNIPASLNLVNNSLLIEYSDGQKKTIDVSTAKFRLLPKTSSLPLQYPFSINDVTVYCESVVDRLSWIAKFEAIQKDSLQNSTLDQSQDFTDDLDLDSSVKIILVNQIAKRSHTLYFTVAQYRKLTLSKFRNHVSRTAHLAHEEQQLFINGQLISSSDEERKMSSFLPKGGGSRC